VAGVSPILAAVAALLDDAAAALTRTLRAELASERSELRAWLVERLDHARLALIAGGDLRSEVDAWAKARQRAGRAPTTGASPASSKTVCARSAPDGAVRMIEEHAGADLQFIRVNGTVVGGLAGGLI